MFFNRISRKYLKIPDQIFTPHELMSKFFESPDLIPSPEITLESIVYGKITQTVLASDLEHFSEVRIFFVTKNFRFV